MTLQLTHTTTPFRSQKSNIVLLCDGVQSPANIGSIFRICDSFGVQEIIFCNASINFKSTRLLRTARDTVTKTQYRCVEDIHFEIETLKLKKYTIIALEISKKSIPLNQFTLKNNSNIALIIGSERTGISEDILKKTNKAIHIEMYGQNSSMNVVQATAITLYALTNI